jgi:alpha-L-rhamnosidase
VKMQVSFGPPTLLLRMDITYTDGTKEMVSSDESWKYANSPLTFNDMYGGEDYDAQLEQPGWDTPMFNDADWQPVVVQTPPEGQLKPQTTDPVKIMETYAPQSVKRVGDAYVFDMGQNLSGFPRVTVKGKKGDVIRLIVGENIHEDGLVNQSQSGSPYYYTYTLKGDGEEVWQPRFTYYGYRYIQVEGAKPEKMESCFVYNSSDRIGHFKCSNPLFNDAYRLIINAVKSNMHAVFTDCPHREKLGWLEQVHLNGPGLFYNFNLTTFAPKIMQDIRDAQLPNGLVPISHRST